MSDRSTTLRELADLVGGRLQGDPAAVIRGAAAIRDVAAGEITLVDQPERLKQLAATPAAAVVVPEQIGHVIASATTANSTARLSSIVVADVHAAFTKIVCHFRPPRSQRAVGISPQAIVSPSAHVGMRVNIHAGATVGEDCDIGDDTTILPGTHLLAGCRVGRGVMIGPGVVLYEDTIVGDRTIIHGGAVIGAHGFGYSQADGRHVAAAQLGYVRIGSDVEIGACTTIDRGTYGATSVGDGTKIDNLVQIAHNCRIGRHNLICAQVGIAGSSSSGDYVVMGGQAGVRDHVHIGEGAMLSAMAGVTNDVPNGAMMMGIPATPEREQKIKQAAWAKLPQMRKEFKAMQRLVAALDKLPSGTAVVRHESDQAA